MKPRASTLRPTAATQPVGVRHAAHGDDEPVAFELLREALVVGVIDRHGGLARGDLVDLHAHLDVEALLGELLPGLLGDRLVAGAEKIRQRFEDRDFGAEPAPHASQLEADHACADHAQALGHRRKGERAFVVADEIVVHRRVR
jgi:hypothetical protein